MYKSLRLWGILILVGLTACATSPLGRRQIKLFSDQDVAQQGMLAFRQIAQKTPVSTDARINAFVGCVARAISAQSGYQANWNIKVFQSKEVNAFALPGGEIGVYTGMLNVIQNQDQLAAVLGHEVSHVVAGHANERMSDAYLTDAAMQLAGSSGRLGQAGMAALGLGAQVGILLPFSRTQESEADLLGLDLMARAGFDPRQAVDLWRNMMHAGGGRPPELLSDHPADERRIQQIQSRLPQDLPLYEQAQNNGRRPQCGVVPKPASS
jgi:predicted Zn-dependent protease